MTAIVVLLCFQHYLETVEVKFVCSPKKKKKLSISCADFNVILILSAMCFTQTL